MFRKNPYNSYYNYRNNNQFPFNSNLINIPKTNTSLINNNALKGIGIGTILAGISKTVSTVNQALPIINQVKPLLGNAKQVFNIAKTLTKKKVNIKNDISSKQNQEIKKEVIDDVYQYTPSKPYFNEK